MIFKNLYITFEKGIRAIKERVLIDKNEERFIKNNIKLWSKKKISSSKKVILVDLFYWNPFINFWSIIVNVLAERYGAETKFFYFDFYSGKASKFSFFISKIKKLYKSFNVDEGICEYNFKYTSKENDKYLKMYQKIKNINEFDKFKRDGIKLGDLMYDIYLRTQFINTIRSKDQKLKKIFFRTNKFFDEVNKYFKENKVLCVLPSHTLYMYGVICRVAIKHNVPVIRLFSRARGNKNIHLSKLDKDGTEEYPFYNYRKTFNKLNKKEKNKALKIGKRLINHRISGDYDKTLAYMPISAFSKKKSHNSELTIPKPKIFLFPHCYLDAPHRYRSMVFNDFYQQMKFFLDQSKKLDQYQLYYKAHPNELNWSRKFHEIILKDYPKVIRLKKNFSHASVIKANPSLIVTNHGTIAHEYAFHNVPVLNTGDNPHIAYKFCFHAKSKNHILKILNNLKKESEKLKFDKNSIYEYMFMRYVYYANFNDENKYLNDNYFGYSDIKKNTTSEALNKSSYMRKEHRDSIIKYINLFCDKNL